MKILEHKTLYRDEQFVAFPNLARLQDNRIICAFRHAQERQKEFGKVTHIDPTAKDVFICSEDGGQTFQQELHTIVDDDMISDQDPCVIVLRDGRIIVTYFRWEIVPKGKGRETWGEVFDLQGRVLFDQYDVLSTGTVYRISDDNGKTWRQMPKVQPEGYLSMAVRGNMIELPNGSLLLPMYGTRKKGELSASILMRSDDRGESFYFYSEIARDEACVKNYLEPGIFRTDSGRIIALLRTQTDFSKEGVDFSDTYLNLHIAVSEDEGKTFGPVQEIENLWGSSPFYALRLKNGKVLLPYGYRRAPFGVRCRLCNNELTDITEAEEVILRDDALGVDVGYPHALELDDGTVMVVYYIANHDSIRSIDATILGDLK